MRQTKITCILTTAAFSIISMISSGSLTVYADNYRPYDRSQDLIEFDGETAEEYKISGTGGASTNHYSDIPVSDFLVSNLSPDIVTDLDYTDWWYSEWDDCHYVFLPVTADRSNLIITYTADDTLYLDGNAVTSGEMTSLLNGTDTFQITVVRNYIERRKNYLDALWQPYVMLRGDVNADGTFDIADVVLLQKWLLAVPNTHLPIWLMSLSQPYKWK